MNILAQLDLGTGQWTIVADIDGRSFDVAVGFTDGTDRVTFDGLRFGFTFGAYARTYPEGTMVYEATDQAYITTDRVEAMPGTSVELTVWAENGGERYETAAMIDVPLPPQPFPSWTLDDDANWQPPVPYPTDGEAYTWDEDAQEWVGDE